MKYFIGKEECQIRLARDCTRLRLAGADGALVDVAQAGPNGVCVCVCDDVGSLQVVAAVSTQGQMNIMLPYFHIVGHSELVEMLSVLK